jgi:hypothetical protein
MWKRHSAVNQQYRVIVEQRAGRSHLIVERYDGQPIRCGWDRLQDIKNAYVGKDVAMVEYFPAMSDVVSEVNRRHLWSIDGPLPM